MWLQGNSCILSSRIKVSKQIEQAASLPNFVINSSVTVVTGSFATTALLAGGTLGTPGVSSSI